MIPTSSLIRLAYEQAFPNAATFASIPLHGRFVTLSLAGDGPGDPRPYIKTSARWAQVVGTRIKFRMQSYQAVAALP